MQVIREFVRGTHSNRTQPPRELNHPVFVIWVTVPGLSRTRAAPHGRPTAEIPGRKPGKAPEGGSCRSLRSPRDRDPQPGVNSIATQNYSSDHRPRASRSRQPRSTRDAPLWNPISVRAQHFSTCHHELARRGSQPSAGSRVSPQANSAKRDRDARPRPDRATVVAPERIWTPSVTRRCGIPTDRIDFTKPRGPAWTDVAQD